MHDKDNNEIYVEVSASPVRNQEGNIVQVVHLSKDITERKKAEEERNKLLHDYGERIKELHCLYGMAKLVEKPGVSLEEILQGTANLLPPAWQYPDVACARIFLEGREFKTKNFRETPWKQQTDIKMHKKRVGTVGVYYSEEKPTIDEGPFQKEERDLVDAVAERLGRIAERKKTEKALQEREEKFKTLAEQSPNMIFVNKKGRVVYTNRKCEEIMGYKREEFYSPDFDFLTLIAPEFKDLIKASFSRHMKGEGVVPYEFILVTKEGKGIDVMITTNLIRYDGESAILGILTDITKRKRMEDELRRYSENLEELVEERTRELKESQGRLIKSERLAAIGELATMVGHDLRNPLQSIENATYYLNNELSHHLIPQKAMKMLQVISDSVNYADRIIRDLKDFSVTNKPIFKKTNINTIVKEALSQVEAPENMELITELDHLPKIKADKDMMKRVFLNLALNGIQAMENGGTLKVSTTKTKRFIEASFRDTGIGMSKENIEKIFTPFFTTKAKGMGMGLAICKRFVDSHGGSIQVESEEGKGSTFTVKLPIQPRRMEVKTIVED